MRDLARCEPAIEFLLRRVLNRIAHGGENARPRHLLAGQTAKPEVRVVDQPELAAIRLNAAPGNADRNRLENETKLCLLRRHLGLGAHERR